MPARGATALPVSDFSLSFELVRMLPKGNIGVTFFESSDGCTRPSVQE